MIEHLKELVMIIERTKNEILFRFPATIKVDDLQDLVNLFKFREVAQKSQAKQKQVDELVRQIKKGRWQKTKQKIGL
nr:hypothetical protein [Bacteroidota bacterium]